MSTFWFVSEIVSYMIWSFIIPFSVYANIKLRRNKNDMFVEKRSRSILYGLNVSISCCIIAPLLVEISLIHYEQYRSLVLFVTLYFFLSLWLVFFFLITKNWLIYYKYHWSYYTIESEWQNILSWNSDKLETNINWFILHNKSYGNLHYVFKCVGIYCFVGFMICCIASVLFIKIYLADTASSHVIGIAVVMLLVCSAWFPPVLFYIYIVRKTPSFDDIFLIHKESKLHAKLLLFCLLMYATLAICYLLILEWYAIIYGITGMGLGFCGMIYISTLYIIGKNKLNTGTAVKSESNKSNISLSMVMGNKDALHLFMLHLSKEYNMECLLFVIEINEFQKYIQNKTKQKDKNILIDFPSTFSNMCCLNIDSEETEIISSAKVKAHRLYNKYIAIGSELEINISFEERNNLKDLLHDLPAFLKYNLTLMDLYQLFQDSKQTVIKSLRSSFDRFKMQTEYVKLYNINEITKYHEK